MQVATFSGTGKSGAHTLLGSESFLRYPFRRRLLRSLLTLKGRRSSGLAICRALAVGDYKNHQYGTKLAGHFSLSYPKVETKIPSLCLAPCRDVLYYSLSPSLAECENMPISKSPPRHATPHHTTHALCNAVWYPTTQMAMGRIQQRTTRPSPRYVLLLLLQKHHQYYCYNFLPQAVACL